MIANVDSMRSSFLLSRDWYIQSWPVGLTVQQFTDASFIF